MAKFYGEVGYIFKEESAPGVWSDKVIKRNYVGDILRNSTRWESGENLNDDLRINNKFSIIADSGAFEKIYAMRFIKWMGEFWKINTVEKNYPRINITVGGIYNGKTD